MLDKLTGSIDHHGEALTLRARRQQVLAGNIANADTPGFKARDFDFATELAAKTKSAEQLHRSRLATTDAGHMGTMTRGADNKLSVSTLLYRTNEQASLDGNTVNLDRERANFADNTMRYEASLRFINGGVRRVLTAMRGE